MFRSRLLSVVRNGVSARSGFHSGIAASALNFKTPVKDIQFVLNDVLNAEKHYKQFGKDEVNKELISNITEECAKLSEEVLAPLNAPGDAEGCKYDNKTGNVTTPKGFKEAYRAYAEGGWQGLSVAPEFGGQGLPLSLGLIKSEIVGTANWSFGMYPGLSVGCMNTLSLHGSEQQKKDYLPKLASGEWLGTMCLTEPQCGSDLGQVETKALKQADGTYKITGTKIYISAGEHDLTSNIIHIVLARCPGAPKGTRGISLFIIPKFLLNPDGSLSKTRNVKCGAIEHKMGIKASATCVMQFDESVGYLIGEENLGLRYMFTFMNTARIGTAIQGVATSELAYQNAIPHALDRRSMRSPSGPKDKEAVADRIFWHPDVRRMLLTAKAFAEGGRCMLYNASLISDYMLTAKTAAQVAKVDEELGLQTPILKGFLTETSLEAASHGMQVYGGGGFIVGNGMEQIYRDARIGTMYEGTTGIQGMDLLGRKIILGGGWKTLGKFAFEILGFCQDRLVKDFKSNPHKREALQQAGVTLKWLGLTAAIMAKATMNKDIVGSAAVDYLNYSGYATMGYWWLRMMHVAQKKLNADPTGPDADYYRSKILTGQFFFAYLQPRTKSLAKTMLADPSNMMKMREKEFRAYPQ